MNIQVCVPQHLREKPLCQEQVQARYLLQYLLRCLLQYLLLSLVDQVKGFQQGFLVSSLAVFQDGVGLDTLQREPLAFQVLLDSLE